MRYEIVKLKENILYIIKWTLIAVFFGIFIGSVGAGFGKIIQIAGVFWHRYDFSIFLLPFLGLIIVFFFRIMKEEDFKGANLVLASIHSNEKMNLKMFFLVAIPTILTHFGAGSSGKEGASLIMGGSLGSFFADYFKFDDSNKKTAIMCGMSACFAALFGTPLAVAVFCIEVISVGSMYYSALVPCIVSAYIGTEVAKKMNLHPVRFDITDIPSPDFKMIALIILLGIACALLVIIFYTLLTNTAALYKKLFINPYVRIFIGGSIFVMLTLLVGSKDYSGGGMMIVERSLRGDIPYEAFLFKMIFTAIVLGAGFRGGEIVPTLAVGASFGAAFGNMLGISPSLFAACAMMAAFAGMTNCPLASIFMAIEFFGMEALPYYAIAIAICFTLSGYGGIYKVQRFAYNKIRLEYLNEDREMIEKRKNR